MKKEGNKEKRKKLEEGGRKGEINEWIRHLYQTNGNRKQLYIQNCGAMKEFFARTFTIYSVNMCLLHRVTHRTDLLETDIKSKLVALCYL